MDGHRCAGQFCCELTERGSDDLVRFAGCDVHRGAEGVEADVEAAQPRRVVADRHGRRPAGVDPSPSDSSGTIRTVAPPGSTTAAVITAGSAAVACRAGTTSR